MGCAVDGRCGTVWLPDGGDVFRWRGHWRSLVVVVDVCVGVSSVHGCLEARASRRMSRRAE